MLDSRLRPVSASGTASQRRARRPQPYAASSTSSFRDFDSNASGTLSTGISTPGGTSTELFAGPSSRTSSDSPSSSASPSDMSSSLATHNVVLQRGSACLTCRRRKLKCDADKPACSACVRTGRSQTCSYDDGLPKSRVQLLTGKVRDLEEKILAMESARNVSQSPANVSHQGQMPTPPVPDLLPYVPAPSTDNDVYSFDSFGSTQDLDFWKTLGAENNELIDLAATLAEPTPAALPYPRSNVLDTIGKLTPWWELDEIPLGMQQHLLNIFLPRGWEPGVAIDISRLWKSISGPAASQHHPCFLNAMYLVGCFFSGDKALQDLEPVFLTKTRKGMETSLVQGDRLIDFIRASNLLSFYYYSKGRLLEGHHLSSTTARFAIACGLHRMSSTRWWPESGDIIGEGSPSTSRIADGPNLIPRPRTTTERNEYIHAFWTVYMQDLGGGLVTGLPTSVADSEITTSWPLGAHSDYQTIVPIYSGLPGTADMSHERHSQALRVKTMCILARATRLSSALVSTRFPDQSLWFKHEACERAIAECSRTLPVEMQQLGIEGAVALLVARATLLAATIQLHSPLAATHSGSRRKCLDAADTSMEVLRALRFTHVTGGQLLLFGLDWAVITEFYAAERTRLISEDKFATANTIDKNIQEIMSEMSTIPPRLSGAINARNLIDIPSN